MEVARKASGQSESDAARIKDAQEGINAYKRREADATAEMERVKKSGAQNMALRKKDLPALRDAANRWTDNAFELRKYLVEKCNCDPKQADEMLGTDSAPSPSAASQPVVSADSTGIARASLTEIDYVD